MITADAIIIGGGIAGVSLAAELAGQISVVLLETESMPGYHATGRSAAVFVPNYGDGPIRELSRASRAHFDQPDPEFWPCPLLAWRGLLRLASTDGEAAHLKQIEDAAGVDDISLAEAQHIFPLLRQGRFVRASFEADVHDIDVDALLQGYLRKARRAGATIATGQAASAIIRGGGSWEVDAGEERYAAPIIINAAGAWADQIATMAGIAPLGLKPCRRSVAVLPMPDLLKETDEIPFVVPFPLGWYAKANAGRLLVSAGDEDMTEPHDAYADDMALAEGLDRFTQDTVIEIQRVETSWAGLRTFSPDGYPVVGYDSQSEGFFWFAGQGGFGIQTAPAMALIGVGDILGASGANRFNPARFHEIRPA